MAFHVWLSARVSVMESQWRACHLDGGARLLPSPVQCVIKLQSRQAQTVAVHEPSNLLGQAAQTASHRESGNWP